MRYMPITLIIPWPLVKHNCKDNIIIKRRVDRKRKLLTIKQRRRRGNGLRERDAETERQGDTDYKPRFKCLLIHRGRSINDDDVYK